MAILFHYASKPFDNFDISMCDGIWLTDIEPENEDMLNEIGAAGSAFVAVVEVELGDLEVILNGDNHEVEGQLESEGADYILNMYDGFEDYAFSSNEHLTIKEWIKL